MCVCYFVVYCVDLLCYSQVNVHQLFLDLLRYSTCVDMNLNREYERVFTTRSRMSRFESGT
jgi:hypothetical protein